VQAVCARRGQGQKHRLMVRAWVLRYLADRLEHACEEGIEVPTIGALHNLERRRGNTTPIDLLIFENPRPSEKRGKHGGVTQQGDNS
jgi:hypothetical protein